ncbi:MAG: halocarboxylic acid dehydrogenase DehI family protein [Candidatus Korobacteraceae bacterium]
MHIVRESEANESIGEVYNDIKSTLSLPQVPLFFQMCAASGPFLRQFWETAKPVVSTRAFMTAAQRLRADAYTRMHNYFEIPAVSDSLGLAPAAELAATLELFHYQDGALLLLLSLAAEAFDNPIGQPLISREEGSPQSFSFAPTLIEEEAVASDTRKVLDEIRREYGLGVAPMELRALAAWPAFLNQHWQLWKQMTESPILAACEHQLMAHSIELALALPGPVELSSASLRQDGMTEEEFSSIVRVTNNWNRASAMLLLETSVARISVEGGNVRPQPTKESKRAA